MAVYRGIVTGFEHRIEEAYQKFKAYLAEGDELAARCYAYKCVILMDLASREEERLVELGAQPEIIEVIV